MEQLSFDFDMTAEERAVFACLRPGRARAVTSRQIAQETGIEERAVRDLVKHLREARGCCIGSSSGLPAGYYILDDPAELEAFTASMRRRGISILYMVSKVTKSSLEAVFNQGRLDLEGKATE